MHALLSRTNLSAIIGAVQQLPLRYYEVQPNINDLLSCRRKCRTNSVSWLLSLFHKP